MNSFKEQIDELAKRAKETKVESPIVAKIYRHGFMEAYEQPMTLCEFNYFSYVGPPLILELIRRYRLAEAALAVYAQSEMGHEINGGKKMTTAQQALTEMNAEFTE